MRCDIHNSPGWQNRLQGSNSHLTVGTDVLQRRAAMRKGARSVAIGWTKELHATAMRYTNRGSEDVRLELVTTGPCMTVELTDFSCGNAHLWYNSNHVSEWVTKWRVRLNEGVTQWVEWVTEWLDHPSDVFTYSHKPPFNKFRFRVNSSSLEVNTVSLEASKPFYLLTVRDDDSLKIL
jgi:hypothetical protein